jgi:hypothetical protein
MRRQSKSVAAIVFTLATRTAMLATFVGAEAGRLCPMICCASGDGGSCPMHAARRGSSLQSCPSDPDTRTPVGRIVLAIPIRTIAFFDRHPSGALFDAVAPPELSRSEKPALPPPENLA